MYHKLKSSLYPGYVLYKLLLIIISESKSHLSVSNSCNPYTVHGILRPEYWCGQHFPSPGDLSNPGIKPRSPALQADSSPAEPQGKPKRILEWVAYPFSSDSSESRNGTAVSCIAGRSLPTELPGNYIKFTWSLFFSSKKKKKKAFQLNFKGQNTNSIYIYL